MLTFKSHLGILRHKMKKKNMCQIKERKLCYKQIMPKVYIYIYLILPAIVYFFFVSKVNIIKLC